MITLTENAAGKLAGVMQDKGLLTPSTHCASSSRAAAVAVCSTA